MTKLIASMGEMELLGAAAEGEALWLDSDTLERATGWTWKAHGLCRDEFCLPLSQETTRELAQGDRLDVAGLWTRMGWPLARSVPGDLWVLGEESARRASVLSSLQAPDFELPDLDGRPHRLSDHRGTKVLLVTWASWCGCRSDLPMWRNLHETHRDLGFSVIAVALDRPEAARPWIEAAAPTYPCPIDRDHLVAELYHFVNVPQAVWIDEEGRLVRPPETAGLTDGFRSMDRSTFAMPPERREERERARTAYLDAVVDWVVHGKASRFALSEEEIRERLRLPDPAVAQAHARFRLGQALLREGREPEAESVFAEAVRLHPDSWAMWRQTAAKNAQGLAVGEEFWRRVDALGDRPYYPPAIL